jgi:hypothetical protein
MLTAGPTYLKADRQLPKRKAARLEAHSCGHSDKLTSCRNERLDYVWLLSFWRVLIAHRFPCSEGTGLRGCVGGHNFDLNNCANLLLNASVEATYRVAPRRLLATRSSRSGTVDRGEWPQSCPAGSGRQSGRAGNAHLRTSPLVVHSFSMTTRPTLNHLFGWLAAFPLLAGCAAKASTFEETADAVRNCGMSPDDLLGRGTNKGQVIFGRKRSDPPGPSFEQVDCFLRWARENKVEVVLVTRAGNGS